MLPIGRLMREHRAIERMIARIGAEVEAMREGKRLDAAFLEEALDFLRTYADRTHHGKEEDILFRDLAAKPLTPEHRRIIDELVREHSEARRHVDALAGTRALYLGGEEDVVGEAESHLSALLELYPRHIEKEDRRFFYPVMGYFTPAEKEAMMREFDEFDAKMIHERYGGLAEEAKPREGVVLMRCTVCGYVYDPASGDPEHGVAPGTTWGELPPRWVCPVCHAAKSLFERIS